MQAWASALPAMVRLTNSGGGIIRDAAEHLSDIRDRLGYARDHCRRVERVIAWFIEHSGATTVEDLRPIAVMRFLADRSAKGTGRKTQLNDAAALRAFADWLVSVERLASNPLRGLKLPRVPFTRGCDPFTLDEVRRLVRSTAEVEATDGRAARFGPLRSTFYAFLARTGLRHTEARVQRWADIDLPAAIMVVTQAKGGLQHVVPLDRETVRLLRSWSQWSSGDMVFPSVPSHHSLVRDMERAGLADKPGEWHRFRKMSITERASRGATVRAMQMIARHRDPKTTQKHYDFVRIEEMREASELLPPIIHNPKNVRKEY